MCVRGKKEPQVGCEVMRSVRGTVRVLWRGETGGCSLAMQGQEKRDIIGVSVLFFCVFFGRRLCLVRVWPVANLPHPHSESEGE